MEVVDALLHLLLQAEERAHNAQLSGGVARPGLMKETSCGAR